mgnify:CR=1 FL=1
MSLLTIHWYKTDHHKNEYDNKTGIMPHTDGPLYEPFTTVISLGSCAFLEFYKEGLNKAINSISCDIPHIYCSSMMKISQNLSKLM